jgi:hypothetical protein
MVLSIARMHFGKVSNCAVMYTDRLNGKQAEMMHSLLYGKNSRCWMIKADM